MPRLSYFTMMCVLLSFFLLCMALLLIRKPLSVSCPCWDTSGSWLFQRQSPQTEPATASIPVHVFEEHHEALLYWIPAAKNGMIRPSGNTLVHIDAHTDMAVPFLKDILPVGRLPRDDQEVTQMMQRNDVFIQAAILSGLFDRVIWVYPTWLKEDLSGEARDSESHGVLTVTRGGKPSQEICTCEADNTCRFFTGTDADDLKMYKVKPSKCDVKVTYSFSIVSEDKAVAFLKEAVTPGDTVVLDIDEDFYGTEAAGMPLYRAGMSEQRVETLTSYLYPIFCPKTVVQERAADSFFYHVVSKIMHIKEFCDQSGKADCKLDMRALAKELVQETKRRGMDKIFCGKGKLSFLNFRMVLGILRSYTVPQLRALRTVGICKVTSSRTFNASVEFPGMMVCQGGNTPNHTMVEFYTPTVQEVASRTAMLRQVLGSLSSTPKLVTVCRSGRDGYTPRHLAALIESDIISALKDSFPGVTDASVFYDPHLLGGKEGWFSRYDVLTYIPETSG